MNNNDPKKVLFHIEFIEVVKCFKRQRIFTHPLLHPVDKIEEILRDGQEITINEHLGPYNTETETFPVYYDDELTPQPYTWREKLARFILPK